MYAIVEACGRQYKVAEGDLVFVEKLEVNEGDKVVFDNVLLISDGDKIKVGTPTVKNAKVEATVVKLMPYGAFVNVIPGIDGLVHISQISKERLAKVSDALTAGQKINAKITEIDFEAQKINLSIRAAAEEVAEESTEEA